MRINDNVGNYSELEVLWNASNLEYPLDCDEFLSQNSTLASTWFQATIYFLYSTIFVVALIGNGLVCYVVYDNARMQTVTNYFIVNLAVGDILMTLFCVPTSFVSTLILQYWPFGAQLCPIVNYSQAVSVLVSAYTMVAISIDRFIAIMWPLRPRISKKQAKFVILGVWMLALIVSFPIAVVSRLSQPNDQFERCDQYMCQEDWPSQERRYYYSIALMILQYLIPLIVLVFTYTSITIIVWGKRPPGEAQNVRDQRMARSKRKVIKMMMTVVLVFTICWLPFNTLILLIDNDEKLTTWPKMPFLWAALHWLAMSHSCYNPVIYCWMNGRFRDGFMAVLARIPGVGRLMRIRERRDYNTSVAGIPLTGFEDANRSMLRRINTYTTYVSVRHKTNGSHGTTTRSASFRNNESTRTQVRQSQKHFMRLKSHSEKQI